MAKKKEVQERATANVRKSFSLSNFKNKKGFSNASVKFKEQGWIPLSKAFQDITSLPGIPTGHITLLRGHSDTGKTTALLEAAVNAQKKGILPVFIISEMKWSWDHAKEMGLQIEEIKDANGTVVDYEGHFLYADRGSLNTIEEVAVYMADLMDEQAKGNLPYDMCFFWDSIGSIPCDLSVRSNHFDESHLHMMPPFTWFLPTSGIDGGRINHQHSIQFKLPKSWTVTTQLEMIGLEENKDMNIHSYSARDRDDLLDGIAECNSNSVIETTIDGIRHTLDIWDAGGKKPHPIMLERFFHDMKSIVQEHHALFGIIDEEYHTILHLTGGPRGGLEHTNSQTSMVPRTALQPGNV